MIASGEKTEEYREIKEYWVKRLVGGIKNASKAFSKEETLNHFITGIIFLEKEDFTPEIEFKPFTSVTFKNGYQKDAPQMTFECKGITTGKGNTEWGAFPDKDVFIIKLGRRVR